MFSGKIDVAVLQKGWFDDHAIAEQTVADINHLLKKQHGKARTVDQKDIIQQMADSKIGIAHHDGRVVGMGILMWRHCLSHSFASVHNLVVREGYDEIVLSKRVLELIIQKLYTVRFIEIGSGIKSPEVIDMLKDLGFDEKPRVRYRLKIK